MSRTPDIHQFLERYADDVYFLPYRLTQDAIGETDGGIAGLFESDGSDYGSGFANAGGNQVVEALLRYMPVDEIVDRINKIELPAIEQRFSDSSKLSKEHFVGIAEDVVSKWHGALKKAFPEVPEIDSCEHSSKRAVTKYLKFQHIYSDEHNADVSIKP